MSKLKTVDTLIEEFRNGRDLWSRSRVELFVREISKLNKRISELEEAIGGHIVLLNDPQSVEAYEAIGLYIQRFFDAEKREHLIRRIGSQTYVEMGNRIKQLEAQLKNTENLLKGCGYKIIWGDEDDERPRLQGHGVSHYPSREDE